MGDTYKIRQMFKQKPTIARMADQSTLESMLSYAIVVLRMWNTTRLRFRRPDEMSNRRQNVAYETEATKFSNLLQYVDRCLNTQQATRSDGAERKYVWLG